MFRLLRHTILFATVLTLLQFPASAGAQYREPSHAYQAQGQYYFGSSYPYTYGHAAPSFRWGWFGTYQRTYQFSGQQHSYTNDFFQQSFR